MGDQLSDLDVKAHANLQALNELLDTLLGGFRELKEHDDAGGATNDEGALGGLLFVIDEGIPAKQVRLLLALAVQRIAAAEVRHG